MRIGIVGSREFYGLQQVRTYVDDEIDPRIDVIISGGASGVDQVAEAAAKKRGCRTIIHLPDYETHGRLAPLVRNKLIVADCEMLVAFWDGQSRGTLHAIGAARDEKRRIDIRLDRRPAESRRFARSLEEP